MKPREMVELMTDIHSFWKCKCTLIRDFWPALTCVILKNNLHLSSKKKINPLIKQTFYSLADLSSGNTQLLCSLKLIKTKGSSTMHSVTLTLTPIRQVIQYT